MPETHYAKNGDVTIAYETFGDLRDGEPLLLVMGLDFQMVWWPDRFCELLAEHGFGVVRYDNRDTGLSTKFDSKRKENAWKALLGGSKAEYTGIDMLNDGLAVMDAVGWQSANVMGASMGAALAQGLASTYPERVRALISVSGLPGDAGGFETLKYLKFGWFPKMMRIKKSVDRDSEIEMLTTIMRTISGTYPFPEEWARETAGISYDRSPRDPKSTQRQLAATRASKIKPLSTIKAPTLVIAGDHDPIVKTKGGQEVAKRIPNATLVVYPGMGHDFPEALWDDMVKRIEIVTGNAA